MVAELISLRKDIGTIVHHNRSAMYARPVIQITKISAYTAVVLIDVRTSRCMIPLTALSLVIG